ncbi:uncharacterized protein KGF55_000704 [Candida pseudojiufengensis]|uniref:uncharacterized protein n=1 Tax=Candida pseudojiufengensis TaxID=497109 RepID=UPI0022259C18|nr:uncharacterized protein KGF55_000704 [Candida pseudojiufengensis]KAI5966395.1 hypothetical protein KGF55_000704 [Candida pseudojiufengensis]
MSTTSSASQPLIPSTRSKSISNDRKPRRRSFLDFGGSNSLNNFASSYDRAQKYSGTSFMEGYDDDHNNENNHYNNQGQFMNFESSSLLPSDRPISPCDEESYIGDEENQLPQGENRIRHFQFPDQSLRDSNDSNKSNNEEEEEEEEENHDDEFTPLIPTISKNSISSSSITKSFILKIGNSTSLQTIFNSINTLVGIGMFSLPFGFKLSGWVIGIFLLISSALVTNITSKYLGKILKLHPNLMTYGDISFKFGGKFFSILITFFFIIDLFGASLSLIILFSDCFFIIWENLKFLKLICILIIFITSFLPLHILSRLSLFGIFSTIGIISIIIISGFIINEFPGSLINFAETSIYPTNFKNFCFSLGIFMAPWGGHPVFPELYRDMKNPKKYNKTSNISFFITFILDFTIGIIGYLMYGNLVDDSIIKNIMSNSNMPNWINQILYLLLGILPISKLPLVTRPIITTYENLLGISIHHHHHHHHQKQNIFKSKNKKLIRIIMRILFCILLLLISILFKSFGKLISFLGSAICYTVCLTLPLLFYLKLNYSQIDKFEKILIYFGIIVSIILSILGTYASITVRF